MGRHFLVNGLLTAGRQEARERIRVGILLVILPSELRKL
jgi:hypothetical protein